MVKRLSIRDVLFVDSVLKEPEVWDRCADDGISLFPDRWTAYGRLANPDNYFLCPFKDETAAGLIMFYKWTSFCWEIHIAMLRQFRGKFTVEATKEALRWMFENTNCLKITARIPACNLPPTALARAVGMKQEGRSKDAWQKGGVLYDVLYFGTERRGI